MSYLNLIYWHWTTYRILILAIKLLYKLIPYGTEGPAPHKTKDDLKQTDSLDTQMQKGRSRGLCREKKTFPPLSIYYDINLIHGTLFPV